MKGVRFYLEHDSKTDKRKGNHNGNVLAVFLAGDGRSQRPMSIPGRPYVEAMGALFFRPNSPVVGTSAHFDFLRDRCKRISEAKARKIHPALFAKLDEPI